MITVSQADELVEYLDVLQRCRLERNVDENMLQAFTEISQDNAVIHKAGGVNTVIPGNLLISLIPAMLQSGLYIEEFDHCKTVSIEKIRFHHSVSLREQLSLEFKVTRVRRLKQNCFVTVQLILSSIGSKQKILSAEQCDCYVD